MSKNTLRGWRQGQRVEFRPMPGSLALYSSPPRVGIRGTVKPVSLGGGKARITLPGPGGGLVYVHWDDGTFQGVSSHDLIRIKVPRARARVVANPFDSTSALAGVGIFVLGLVGVSLLTGR